MTIEMKRIRINFAAKKKTHKFQKWFIEELNKLENLCPICNDDMLIGLIGEKYPTVDHILEVCEGGNNDYSNLRVICNKCNHLKEIQRRKRL